MAEQVRETQVTTTYAIVDKTKPGVLYGEGTFTDGAAAEETAHNLNALLSADARVYRAAEHKVSDSLTVVGEEDEYVQAPARPLVTSAPAAEAAPEVPTADAEATGEPVQPGEFRPVYAR